MKYEIDIPPDVWLDLQIHPHEDWSLICSDAIRERVENLRQSPENGLQDQPNELDRLVRAALADMASGQPSRPPAGEA